MSPVLVVWELVPESIQFFLVEPNDEKDYETIINCNGKMVNCVSPEEDEIAQWLAVRLTLAGVEEVKLPFTVNGAITVVHSGFML